ncbi:MAG: hypothetical protein A4E61_00246 [Syntrophorhabdus sp. PtaB.Bin184]|nr:MAG: hypothetical protein A4E61_00246 [Syntrophorhabdus sp. PtaB.Bin184]
MRAKRGTNQPSLFAASGNTPFTVAYGMGVDSTAMLVGLVKHRIRPDLILFADTAAERPETYEYRPVFEEWLQKEGFPPITTVKYAPRDFKNWPPYYTLEDNCLTNGTLPGIAFGAASCSVKWKQGPQHGYIRQWEPARQAWAVGQRVIKAIGFDNSPRDRVRTYSASPKDADLYDYVTPLIRWQWDREECKKQIASVGLPVPVKSSCFFCTAMKPWEVRSLRPDMLRRIVRMEARAFPRLTSCEGLWRNTVKGTRGGTARPGSMTTLHQEKPTPSGR